MLIPQTDLVTWFSHCLFARTVPTSVARGLRGHWNGCILTSLSCCGNSLAARCVRGIAHPMGARGAKVSPSLNNMPPTSCSCPSCGAPCPGPAVPISVSSATACAGRGSSPSDPVGQRDDVVHGRLNEPSHIAFSAIARSSPPASRGDSWLVRRTGYRRGSC